MWNSRSSFYFSIILFIVLTYNVDCKCVLQISLTKQPLFTQKFGSKEIILSNLDNQIELDDNAKLQATCALGFNSFNFVNNGFGYRQDTSNRFSNEQTLYFQCLSNKLFVNVMNAPLNDYEMSTNNRLGCSGTVYSMYESTNKLPNCEDELSYALGVKLSTPIIVAGLCYDLNNLILKYISYKLHEPSAMLDTAKQFYPAGLNGSSLKEPLQPIETLYKFPSQVNITDYINNQTVSNFWLRIANYELHSIEQTSTYYRSTLNEFQNFLNIIWWHNLRTGNWRRFIELLEMRSKTITYNVYTGTSSVVRVPAMNKCQEKNNLVINYQNNPRIVPEFIWTYLQTNSENIADDFVVIAYNSPYFEYFERNSTILCEDICDEIDWLVPMKNSRLISTFGTLYCCRPEAVIGLLDGFPLKANYVTSSYSTTTITP